MVFCSIRYAWMAGLPESSVSIAVPAIVYVKFSVLCMDALAVFPAEEAGRGTIVPKPAYRSARIGRP
jgi:hypothetical protein